MKLSKKQQQAVAEAIERLKNIQETVQKSCDVEVAHANADSTLCDLLDQLGLQAVTAEYDKVEKWYA